jgi:hypothetical protein
MVMLVRKFIVNKKGYYFCIEDDIDFSKLHGCLSFPDLASMYSHVVENHSLGADEVECGEMVIRNGRCFDPRGIGVLISGPVESFVADFLM